MSKQQWHKEIANHKSTPVLNYQEKKKILTSLEDKQYCIEVNIAVHKYKKSLQCIYNEHTEGEAKFEFLTRKWLQTSSQVS